MENQPGTRQHLLRLNESPSKKEGKYSAVSAGGWFLGASMKAPPRRKGNPISANAGEVLTWPQ